MFFYWEWGKEKILKLMLSELKRQDDAEVNFFIGEKEDDVSSLSKKLKGILDS